MKPFRYSLTVSIVVPLLLVLPQQVSGYDFHHVVINEVMYDPLSEETEWIEIFNGDGLAVELAGWTIEDTDSTRPRLITNIPIVLESNNYLCIVDDTSAFVKTFPSIFCPALRPVGGWPRLNNSEDRIVLRDAQGVVVDRVKFKEQWGGGDGRSLERIRPEWPSNDPGTWSSCSPPALSTPCAQNSIFFPSPPSRASISVDPDPFETETHISYLLTVPTATIKLEIYDMRGLLVRRLVDQEARASSGTVSWDGRDDKGHRLRMGIYIIHLEAIHAERGVLERAKSSVTLVRSLR